MKAYKIVKNKDVFWTALQPQDNKEVAIMTEEITEDFVRQLPEEAKVHIILELSTMLNGCNVESRISKENNKTQKKAKK